MSAFMCSNEHIAILAEYACSPGRSIWRNTIDAVVALASRKHPAREDRSEAEIVGAALHAANAASLRARYPSDHEDMVGPAYAHPSGLRLRALRVPAVAIVKSALCFRYQACEADDWEGSPCDRLIEAIISDALGRVPGYEEAAWGAPEMPKLSARVAAAAAEIEGE